MPKTFQKTSRYRIDIHPFLLYNRLVNVSFDTLLGGEIIKNALKGTFLFSGFSDVEYNLAKQYFLGEARTFERGEVIYSPSVYERKIGFVVSGECEVRRSRQDGSRVTLNTISRGGSFGISAVFSDEDFPTVIYAKKRSSVVFITRDELLDLMGRFPAVSLNIIRFQNDRIAFLNKKIETFSAGSVEERVACYILGEYKKLGTVELPLNRMKTADALGVGRASLYRALDSLADSGIISLDTKKIVITDLEGLERISK